MNSKASHLEVVRQLILSNVRVDETMEYPRINLSPGVSRPRRNSCPLSREGEQGLTRCCGWIGPRQDGLVVRAYLRTHRSS